MTNVKCLLPACFVLLAAGSVVAGADRPNEPFMGAYIHLSSWFRDAPDVLKGISRPVEFTICVGISTSHGKIREAKELEDYLDIGKRHGVQGAAFFTWETLQPYLPEVKQAGYLEQFTTGLQPPAK